MSKSYNRLFGKSSKKRFPKTQTRGHRVRKPTRGTTLTVIFPDGARKVCRPDMSKFDGDWKNLALSLCEGNRITWEIS